MTPKTPMTDREARGWISADRAHGVKINSGILNDLASEVLLLRGRLAIADELAQAAASVGSHPDDETARAFLANRLAAYRADPVIAQ